MAEEREYETAPIIRIVHTIIQQAIDSKAEEVFVERVGKEPRNEDLGIAHVGLAVRYLIGGNWQDAIELPAYIEKPIIQRLRIMAGLDVIPPDRTVSEQGNIPIRYSGRDYLMTMRTEPEDGGENVRMMIRQQRATISE